MRSDIKDMTQGKPISLMLSFSVPLLFANVLQLMYTMIDSLVVGRMLGVEAFAAVGATASFYWLMLSTVLGITQGFGTIFAQRFGAKDIDGLRKAFATSIILSVVLSVSIGFTTAFGSVFILKHLNTPPELMEGASTFLSFLLSGLPITFALNLLGAMLRAFGNSKTPFYAMVISTMLNILLDFILVKPLGIAGVATATLLAQLTASIFCVFALRKTDLIKSKGLLHWDHAAAKALLSLGLPLGFRNAVIETGGLVVQRYINNYGTDFVAGIAAAKRMYSLLTIAAGAFEAACATFVAQNFGAKDYRRVKRGVSSGLLMMLTSSAAIMAVALLFGRWILSLFITGEPAQIKAVLDIGVRQLNVLALGLPLLYLLFLFRSTLEGIGNAYIPMFSGFLELTMRIFSVTVLTPIWGEWGVYLSDASGWVLAVILLVVSYLVIFKRKLKIGVTL